MKTEVRVMFVRLMLCIVLLIASFPEAATAQSEAPTVLVAVQVRNPDAVLRYARISAKSVPIPDFDFGALLGDELAVRLGAEGKLQWRVATAADGVDVAALMKSKGPLPASIKAERLLLVDVHDYGIFRAWGTSPRFTMNAVVKFIDRANRKIWSENGGPTLKIKGEIEDLQRDNARGFKEGLNEFIGKYVEELAKKRKQQSR
jgi:hypothetical protein